MRYRFYAVMKKIIVGCLIAFLGGCTNDSSKPEAPNLITPVKSHSVSDVVDDVKVEVIEEQTAISPNTLFLLMTAEIAGQRNQYDVALEGYLQAAKQVGDVRLSERAARIGLFLKDTEKTNEAVALWLQNDAKNLTARKIAVLSALRGNDIELAVGHLDNLLLGDPAGFEETLIEFSNLLSKEQSGTLVFSALEKLALQHPDKAVIFFIQALLVKDDYTLALAKVDQALLIQPAWDKALILSAELAAKSGDMKGSKRILNKILAMNPNDVTAQRLLARVLVNLDDFEGARALYSSILQENSDDYASQFAIALIYLREDNASEARKALKKLVNKSRWDAPASFYLGRIDFKQKNYQSALVWFDKVASGAYAYDAALMTVSVALEQQDFAMAEQHLTVLYKNFPNETQRIDLLKSEVFSEQGKYQQAFDFLTEKLITQPDSRDLLYTRALIAEKLNRLDILEVDLKKVIALYPNDASALNALGYTLVDRTERYMDAEIYLEQALKLKPTEAVIIDSMGWLRFKQGRIDQALIYLRDAYSKQPESEIAAHLAEILWGLANKIEAQAIFDRAIEKDPSDEYLLKFQQQFLGK